MSSGHRGNICIANSRDLRRGEGCDIRCFERTDLIGIEVSNLICCETEADLIGFQSRDLSGGDIKNVIVANANRSNVIRGKGRKIIGGE